MDLARISHGSFCLALFFAALGGIFCCGVAGGDFGGILA
jgi:hypothetical protein